jgi:hypothetical protein
MTDGELTPEQRAHLEAYRLATERGEPMMTLTADVPMRLVVSHEGSAAVEFLFGIAPDGTGLMARLVLRAAATQTLPARLLESENIPDGLPAAPDPKRAN